MTLSVWSSFITFSRLENVPDRLSKLRMKSKPLDDGDDPGVGEDEGEEGEEIHQAEEGDVVETVHNSRLQQPCKLPTHQGPTVRDPHLYNRG